MKFTIAALALSLATSGLEVARANTPGSDLVPPRKVRTITVGPDRLLPSAKNEPIPADRSDQDLVISRVDICWDRPSLNWQGRTLVSLQFQLTETGNIDGEITTIDWEGRRQQVLALEESARRAIMRCAPYKIRSKSRSPFTIDFQMSSQK